MQNINTLSGISRVRKGGFQFVSSLLLALGAYLSNVHASEKPNIIFILVDDMGYGDLGCYGSEIDTPNLDSLAQTGLRFTQMYNTSKCMPSRACLLTGVYAQDCGMDSKPLNLLNSVTFGEALRPAGYRTYASGKHHGTENLFDRGFDHYYGLRDGCCNFWNPGEKREGEAEPGRKRKILHWCDDATQYSPYTPEDRNFYTTDAFTNKPLQWLDEKELEGKPFFLYLAYTAPHYPLHAHPKDIEKYKGKYDKGYGAIQKERYKRMLEMGLIDPEKTDFTPIADSVWQRLAPDEQAKEKRRMEIYAAMLDSVDQNIGRLLKKLKEQNKLENTIIMFASDNGACAEKSGAKVFSKNIEDFGNVASYETVGQHWATVQNTPFRKWKNASHEGGIRTPFIINYPNKIKHPGSIYHGPAHFIDIMPTAIELSGASYPTHYKGKPVTPMQGVSILPALNSEALTREQPLCWKWRNGGAVRQGNWKAVYSGKKWELFDFTKDHNESNDLSKEYPEKMNIMKKLHQDWYASTLSATLEL